MTKFVEKVEPTTFKWRYKNFDTFYISLASMVFTIHLVSVDAMFVNIKLNFFISGQIILLVVYL